MSLTALTAIDGYLAMADAANPLGVYLLARSLLELDGIVTFTVSELRRLSDPRKFDWKERGRKTFSFLVRARTATGDPAIRANMDKAGMPAVKVIHVNDGIKALGEQGNLWAKAHYDALSDFAHPNFGSRKVNIAGGYVGDETRYGKSTFILKSNAGITTYRYPAAAAMDTALSATCERALENARHIFKEIESANLPFSEQELLERTGTRSGFVEVPPEAMAPLGRRAFQDAPKIGRNEPCPCGSGKKFKKCHGADVN
jgi:hypothetical protein